MDDGAECGGDVFDMVLKGTNLETSKLLIPKYARYAPLCYVIAAEEIHSRNEINLHLTYLPNHLRSRCELGAAPRTSALDRCKVHRSAGLAARIGTEYYTYMPGERTHGPGGGARLRELGAHSSNGPLAVFDI